jgi:hypothetical protein
MSKPEADRPTSVRQPDARPINGPCYGLPSGAAVNFLQPETDRRSDDVSVIARRVWCPVEANGSCVPPGCKSTM